MSRVRSSVASEMHGELFLSIRHVHPFIGLMARLIKPGSLTEGSEKMKIGNGGI